MEWSTGTPAPAGVEGALEVWRACKDAQGRPPAPTRIHRVREKLEAPDAIVIIGTMAGDTMAMAVAEPGRADDGAGPQIPGRGHVSMLFVHPGWWGRGAGSELLLRLHAEALGRNWHHLALWTGLDNARARRLYESVGYRATGRVRAESDGRTFVHYERLVTSDAAPGDERRARLDRA